jgi:hypothetical protein
LISLVSKNRNEHKKQTTEGVIYRRDLGAVDLGAEINGAYLVAKLYGTEVRATLVPQ